MYCAHTYTKVLSGRTVRYVCVSRPHAHRPDGHHFVEANTTRMSTAAEHQRVHNTPRYLRST